MSTTAEINAYLEWRAEREGKTVDVSPEAYERDQIIGRLISAINSAEWGDAWGHAQGEIKSLAKDYIEKKES